MWYEPLPNYPTWSKAFSDFSWFNKSTFRGFGGLGLAAAYACMCMLPRWAAHILEAFIGTTLLIIIAMVLAADTLYPPPNSGGNSKTGGSFTWLQLLVIVVALISLSV